MSLRRLLPVVTATLGIGGPVLVTPPTAATARPGAGERTGIHSNTALARALARIERTSHGRVDVAGFARTNEGRPLWLATVGTGPIRMLYVTEQHGDEPLGTEAALSTLRAIGSGHDGWARWVRSKITLAVVARANPDGHERDRRFNHDPGARPEYGEPGKGYDINRYHHPEMSPEDNPVPEAAAVQRLWTRFRPSIIVDYHMQGRYEFPDGREITTSVMWPTAAGTGPGAVTGAKRAVVALRDSFAATGAVVSQYPGDSYAGIARNAYGLRGSSSVLVELSDIPGREGFQVFSAHQSMIALAGTAAGGGLAGIDPAEADRIPRRGPEPPEAAALAERADAA